MVSKFSLPLCAALALAPVGASALDFTVEQYGKNQLGTAQSDFAGLIGSNWLFTVAEDFEGTFETSDGDPVTAPSQIGSDHTTSLETAVGSFTTLNGKQDASGNTRSTTPGSGSTAIDTSGGKDDDERGKNLSIRQDDDDLPDGRRQNTSNTTTGDKTYLDSNDTLGMQWIAQTKDGDDKLREFDRLLFTLTDPADVGKTLTISANGFTETHTIAATQPNGEIFNVLIGFSDPVTTATLWLEKSGLNDGFSLDNPTIGAVPLPAAAWLLMFASGGLIAAKRRSARRA